jgi:putative hemolysin
MLVSESHEQGVIDLDERNMINRVMRLGDRTADSLMTPRTASPGWTPPRRSPRTWRPCSEHAVLALPGLPRQRPATWPACSK